ncbi:MAG: phosphate acyltransferase [Geminicoccaceae bacterium]
MDALITGPVGSFGSHLRHVHDVIGLTDQLTEALDAARALVLDLGILFIADTYVSFDPPAEEIATTTLKASDAVRRFGLQPKVALIWAASNFGNRVNPSSRKMRDALEIVRRAAPDLEVDGENARRLGPVGDHPPPVPAQLVADRPSQPADHAQSRRRQYCHNLVKSVTGTVSIGPILAGRAQPAHIVTSSITTRGLVNMSALLGLCRCHHPEGSSMKTHERRPAGRGPQDK